MNCQACHTTFQGHRLPIWLRCGHRVCQACSALFSRCPCCHDTLHIVNVDRLALDVSRCEENMPFGSSIENWGGRRIGERMGLDQQMLREDQGYDKLKRDHAKDSVNVYFAGIEQDLKSLKRVILTRQSEHQVFTNPTLEDRVSNLLSRKLSVHPTLHPRSSRYPVSETLKKSSSLKNHTLSHTQATTHYIGGQTHNLQDRMSSHKTNYTPAATRSTATSHIHISHRPSDLRLAKMRSKTKLNNTQGRV